MPKAHLTIANYPATTALTNDNFAYDLVGNRQVPGDPSQNTYNANNQLTALEAGDITFTYDDDGNLTARIWPNQPANDEIYGYDLSSRLTSFSKAGASASSYGYGPSGRRLFKSVNRVTTWFLWDDGQLLAEFAQSGATATLVKRYDYLAGNYLPVQFKDTNGTYNVHSDHLETSKTVTDEAGVTVWRSIRTAFGEMTENQDVDGDGTAVAVNIRFPGQYFDKETGLHYNYYRDYDPSLGRYIQADPIGLAGGLNFYGYVLQNPLIHTDPLGLATYMCTQPLHFLGGTGAKSGPDIRYKPVLSPIYFNCAS